MSPKFYSDYQIIKNMMPQNIKGIKNKYIYKEKHNISNCQIIIIMFYSKSAKFRVLKMYNISKNKNKIKDFTSLDNCQTRDTIVII
jgi:alpha-galactosidase